MTSAVFEGNPFTLIQGNPKINKSEKFKYRKRSDNTDPVIYNVGVRREFNYYKELTFVIPKHLSDEFVLCVNRERDRLIAEDKFRDLPQKPELAYRPRIDNIVDYLEADTGFGPWLKRNLLTRPLLKELSPKAYMALANFLRTSKLPEHINIPTKSEVLDLMVDSATPTLSEDLKSARSTAERVRYLKKRRNRSLNKNPSIETPKCG